MASMETSLGALKDAAAGFRSTSEQLQAIVARMQARFARVEQVWDDEKATAFGEELSVGLARLRRLIDNIDEQQIDLLRKVRLAEEYLEMDA